MLISSLLDFTLILTLVYGDPSKRKMMHHPQPTTIYQSTEYKYLKNITKNHIIFL